MRTSQQPLDTSTGKPSDMELDGGKCSVHGAQLYYFCSDCSTAICSDCAMFDEKHKGHTFEHLEKVYNTRKTHILEQRQILLERRVELRSVAETIEQEVERVESQRQATADAMRAIADECFARLELEMQESMKPLLDHIGLIREEAETLDSLTAEVDHHIDNDTLDGFIGQFNHMDAALSSVLSTPLSKCDDVNLPDSFPNYLAPPLTTGKLVIADFHHARIDQEPVFSDVIETAPGVKWRLKVYPNGNGAARALFLSVFVEMLDTSQCSQGISKYVYSVTVVHPSDDDIVRNYSSEFVPGESWGYNRLVLLDTLSSDGFINDGSLTLLFGVGAPTYYDQCQDLMQALATSRIKPKRRHRRRPTKKKIVIESDSEWETIED